MIVVAPFGGAFVSGLSVRKFPLGGKAQTSQELQGPVDGGIPDPGIGFWLPGRRSG